MKELIEGEDFYINEDGLVVLTEKYHLEKGYCCGNGCLHCPYNYKNVAEPKKSSLLSKRKIRNRYIFIACPTEKNFQKNLLCRQTG